jgi:predicted NBD/HSP70 family sugar kinase
VLLAGIDLGVFREAFGRPTWVENNSTAAALAEYYSRLDPAVRSLALINVGYGFSAGFVIHGRPYRGRGGNAGEIGRLYPRGTPRPSALDLLHALEADGTPITSTAELAEIAHAGSASLSNWVARAGDQLRHAMDVLDFTIAPDEIILGGQVPTELLTRLSAAVAARSSSRTARQARYRTSQLGPLASAMGAAFLPIYQTSSPLLDSVPGRTRD